MKLVKKIKWLSAVTVLAVGIPAAGIAFASPMEHFNTTKPAAVTQQVKHEPTSVGINKNISTDNNKSLQTDVPASQVHNPVHTNDVVNDDNHSNVSINKQPSTAPEPAPTNNNASGHGYHYGHNGPYDYWCNSNQNYQHSGHHNGGGHR